MRASLAIRRGRSPDLPEIYVMLIAAACVFTCPAFADTTWVAGGDVSGDWTSESSPYMIQGDVRVPPSETLSIGPGVTVFFAVRCSLFVDSAARLEAIGADGDSIYFTTDTLLLPEKWGGIEISYAADTCRFEWCVLERACENAINSNNAALILRSTTIRQNHGGTYGAVSTGWNFLEMSNCALESNSGRFGGAMVLGTPWGCIENCVFRNNRATEAVGGAIFWYDQWFDTLLVLDCQFVDNAAVHGGAVALWLTSSALRFEGCRFTANTADSSGGAVFHNSGTGANFFGCTFEDNSATWGGALYVGGDTVDQCVFTGNTATRGGGVSYAPTDSWTPLFLSRSSFVGNTATQSGAAIWLGYWTNVRSCLAAFNNGSGLRVPAYGYSSAVCFNLLFGNSAGNVFPENSPVGDLIQVNANGDSCDTYYNLVADPVFADTASGDFHLQSTSPCIDAGDPNLPLDPDSTVADIGAFYCDQTQAANPERTAVRRYELAQNYPNPFNAVTRIAFDLPRAGEVELHVFDITGRRVAELIKAPLSAGRHTADFDAARLPSGVYFYRLRANDYAQARKMVLLR